MKRNYFIFFAIKTQLLHICFQQKVLYNSCARFLVYTCIRLRGAKQLSTQMSRFSIEAQTRIAETIPRVKKKFSLAVQSDPN